MLTVRRLASSAGPLLGVSMALFGVLSLELCEDADAEGPAKYASGVECSLGSFISLGWLPCGITRLSFWVWFCSTCFPINGAFLRKTFRVLLVGCACAW